jgi:diguanylate cyclase (GGDEF)-like protein
MLPTVTAPALLGTALLLALAFHRHRMAQMLLVLALAALARVDGDQRLIEGALRFAPWLLLAAALLPEPRLLSKRNLGFVLAVTILAGVAVAAPAHVQRGLVTVARWMAFDRPAPIAAATITVLAALLCTLRWAMTGRPIELGLVAVLAAAATAFAHFEQPQALPWLVASGVLAILAVLYASYRMAFIDGLTGLPNRRALDEALVRLSGHYALAMVDVDHFKQFNDTYGHDAGDIVLRVVGRTVRRNSAGEAYRYGGEEFCVVFEGARAKQVATGCERAREAVAALKIAIPAPSKRAKRDGRAKRSGAVEVGVTISVGFAARSGERKLPWDVLRTADQALYKAKAKGRNRVVGA